MVAGLTQRQAAELVGVSLRTVRNWESRRTRVPYSAFKLMRIARGYALPGEAWAGWTLRGDTLWSPTGKAFPAWGMGYLSLVFSMARQWLRERGEAEGLFTDCSVSSARRPHGRVGRPTAGGNPQGAAGDAGMPPPGGPDAPVGGGGLPGQPLSLQRDDPLPPAPGPLGLSLYHKSDAPALLHRENGHGWGPESDPGKEAAAG